MKKLLLRTLLFGSIFILNAVFIFTIDAYNIFFDSNFIENGYKKIYMTESEKVMPRGNALWKLNEFSKHPCPNIILGDSRAMGINTELIKKTSGEEYYNLAVSGGNFKTIFDLFWIANDNIQLKNVSIQVGFSSYNKQANLNLIKSVKPYFDYPYKMFFKDWFILDSFKALQYKIQKHHFVRDSEYKLKIQERNLGNWDQVIQKQGYAVLENYTYPDNYYNSLKEISEYCKLHNINLQLIIFPNHPDYYTILEDLDLVDDWQRFSEDMHKMGPTIDLSDSGKASINKMSYIDLYHTEISVVDSLTGEIWKPNQQK